MFTSLAYRMALILAVSSVPATAPPKPAAPRPLTVRDVMSPKEEAACGLVHLTAPERAAFEKWLNRYTARVAPPAPVANPGGSTQAMPRTPQDVPPAPPEGGNLVPAPPELEDLPSSGSYVYRDDEPTLIRKVDPRYPESAKEALIAGKVTLNVLVGTDGRVTKVEVVQGVPELNAAAVEAVKQWLFKPAMAHGKPVAVWVAVPLNFNLTGNR